MIRTALLPPRRVIWGTCLLPACECVVGVTEAGEVCRLAFLQARTAEEVIETWRTAWARTDFVRGAGIEAVEDKPILLVGTVFQQAVWHVMSEIPAGSVRTYGELAQSLGKPKASRAVGAACGANPVPYLVPCHRVVAAGGKLGGYSGGIVTKRALLQGEGFLLRADT